jgi:NADPH2:quinone reductase
VRAAVCPHYGPPEVIRIEERPVPTPAAGQALVRVQAAAVNFPDVLLMADQYQISVPPPFVPGSEFAGLIDQIGSDVTTLSIGDRVTGTTLVGAFADAVAVPVAALNPIPDGVDVRTAAAFGVAHRTAYHSLVSVGAVESGDQVIVLGAGGGVGLAAVQLAVALGATVTAVASSSEKLAAAARYGATTLVNYRRAAADEPGEQSGDGGLRAMLRKSLPDGADVVVDPVGGALSEPALRTLRRGGRFVTVGYASGVIPRIPLNLVLIKGIQIRGFTFQDIVADESGRTEDALGALLTTGRVTPHIGASYSLEDTARALRQVADGKAVGKVVIDVSLPG